MNLGTLMPDGERRKPIDDISFLRYCAETKKLTPGHPDNIHHIISRVRLRRNSANKKKLPWSDKWILVHSCLMVRGGSLLILRFVGQRHCPSICSQLCFRTCWRLCNDFVATRLKINSRIWFGSVNSNFHFEDYHCITYIMVRINYIQWDDDVRFVLYQYS
jgi:hypothetical protein